MAQWRNWSATNVATIFMYMSTQNKCAYECGNEGLFLLKNKKLCCSRVHTQCPSIRLKNSLGNKNNPNRNKFQFTDDHRKKSNQKAIERAKLDSFGNTISRLTDIAKKYFRELKNHTCEECSLTSWRGKSITFEIDHIDGDITNNELTNLKLLCPNCHSQTKTWRGRNINNGKKKFSNEEILKQYKKHKNIHKTLIALNMAPKGANYLTIKRVLSNNNIKFKSKNNLPSIQ